MTHYQKLATMVFRTIGLLLILAGVAFGITALASIFIYGVYAIAMSISIFSSIPTMLLGIAVFSLSRMFASWICFDFGSFGEE